MNLVYDTLITQVGHYGGSVIGFAGDAITCWFQDGTQTPAGSERPAGSALRATACALACQKSMQQFAAVPIPGGDPVALAMKVTIASGPARRFLVGDPAL